MKKLFLTTAAFAALTTVASAADLPRKTVAPTFAAAPAFTWTGFYVGANAGYGWGSFKRTATANSVGFGALPATLIDTFSTRSMNAGGMTGGAQIGYNYQINSIVLGLEADFNLISMKKDTGRETITGLGGNFLTSTSKLEWFATVRPRVGVAFDRLLVYATGGLAFGSVKTSDLYNFAGGPTTGTSSTTRTGYAVGAGLEYAFTNNLTMKVEYLFADLGKSSYVAPNIIGLANTNVNLSNKTTVNLVRAGVNYKF